MLNLDINIILNKYIISTLRSKLSECQILLTTLWLNLNLISGTFTVFSYKVLSTSYLTISQSSQANKLLNQSVIPHFYMENLNRDCKEQRWWMRVKKRIYVMAGPCKIITRLIIFVATKLVSLHQQMHWNSLLGFFWTCEIFACNLWAITSIFFFSTGVIQ